MTQRNVKSIIDVAAMTKFNDNNSKLLFNNTADKTVITDTVSPETFQLMHQRFTKTLWIFYSCQALTQVFLYLPLDRMIKLSKIFKSLFFEENFPIFNGHILDQIELQHPQARLTDFHHAQLFANDQEPANSLYNRQEILQEQAVYNNLYCDVCWLSIHLNVVQVQKEG